MTKDIKLPAVPRIQLAIFRALMVAVLCLSLLFSILLLILATRKSVLFPALLLLLSFAALAAWALARTWEYHGFSDGRFAFRSFGGKSVEIGTSETRLVVAFTKYGFLGGHTLLFKTIVKPTGLFVFASREQFDQIRACGVPVKFADDYYLGCNSQK
jgi:hypothetical protein